MDPEGRGKVGKQGRDVAAPGWQRASQAAGLDYGGATSGGGVLAGHGFRGEEVGGGWMMIGGHGFQGGGRRRPKWHVGGV